MTPRFTLKDLFVAVTLIAVGVGAVAWALPLQIGIATLAILSFGEMAICVGIGTLWQRTVPAAQIGLAFLLALYALLLVVVLRYGLE